MFLGLWFCSPLSILHLLSLNSSPPHFSFLSQSKDCETRKRDPVQKLPQWWFPLDRSDPVCIIASLALFGRFCTLRSYLQPLLSLSIPFLFCSCFLLFAVIRSFFLLDLFLFLLLFCFPLFSFFPLLSHCPCAVLPPPIDRRVSLSAPLLSPHPSSPLLLSSLRLVRFNHCPLLPWRASIPWLCPTWPVPYRSAISKV